jgi:hypothetical protein
LRAFAGLPKQDSERRAPEISVAAK